MPFFVSFRYAEGLSAKLTEGVIERKTECTRMEDKSVTNVEENRIIASSLCYRYPEAEKNAVDEVSMRVKKGEFLAILGHNGSGKSTLINDTLYPILNAHFYNALKKPLPYDSIEGLENIDKVIAIDQSPIGRTPRSNPATYTGVFSDIRSLFAEVPESKIRGYKPGRF